MIEKFAHSFQEKGADALRVKYREKAPDSYTDIFTDVVSVLNDNDSYGCPDPKRITVIDHGDYQGTLVFIVGATGYQPNEYWASKVSYGSCSGCDTFQAIRESRWNDDEPISEKEVEGYITLALHMVQAMKEV